MLAQDLVVQYGRPGQCLLGRDARDCAALAAQLHDALKRKFICTLSEDKQQAVLLVGSADGTPLTTRRRVSLKSGELEVLRKQRSTGERLIVRRFLMTEFGRRFVHFSEARKMGQSCVMLVRHAYTEAVCSLAYTSKVALPVTAMTPKAPFHSQP